MPISTVPVAPNSRVRRIAVNSVALSGAARIRSSPCSLAIDELRESCRAATTALYPPPNGGWAALYPPPNGGLAR